ncbi:MAG: hypothetical protein MJZ00_08570 [Paludibacteraceae bacterium]|nr:hypothetical protein [Paludibacteraceae bacterium]
MAKFTNKTIKQLIIANNNTRQIHQEYLDSALGLTRYTSRLSDNDNRRDEIIKKLRENGFREIEAEELDKYMHLYSNRYYIREGLVMKKEGHKLWANVEKGQHWKRQSVSLFDIDHFDDFKLEADTAKQVIYAVENFEKAEEEWQKKWSIEEAKTRKIIDINQRTLDTVLHGIVKKHNWEHAIEKDGYGQLTLLVRISGRQQITMKFKKDVSTEVITKVADVISQLVDLIKTNNDINISVRGVSIKTKWVKPE